jgi:predicted hydrolase (HD superfamily)
MPIKSAMKVEEEVDYFAVIDEDEIINQRRLRRQQIESKYSPTKISAGSAVNINTENLSTANPINHTSENDIVDNSIANHVAEEEEVYDLEPNLLSFDYDPTLDDIAQEAQRVKRMSKINVLKADENILNQSDEIKMTAYDMFGDNDRVISPVINANQILNNDKVEV